MASAPSVPSPPSKKPPRRAGKAKWIVVIGLLAVAAGGATWWLMQPKAIAATPERSAAPAKAAAQYYALDPAFVVNLADVDAVHYLQADVQLMTRDPGTRAALEQHAPALRNRLLLLFGQQSAESLADRRGKERLQQQALSEIRAVLDGEGAPDKVEAVYFTSLVTQ